MGFFSKIAVIGGGTGARTILTGLKHQKDVLLSAIVTMSDDGGHTGVLRDELGVLPPGDLRQCLVALSDDRDDAWRKLFSFRFTDGSGNMSGQNVGNIILRKIFFVCNLVTKAGETDGYKASDFRNRINELISPAHLDVTIVNSAKPAQAIQRRYEEIGEYLVEDDLPHRDHAVYRQALISPEIGETVSGDKVRRSLLRHDGEILAQVIKRLLPES